MAKELDLTKFIQRSRLNSFMALIALSGRQLQIADKLSTCLIRESSELSDNSQDDFKLDQECMIDLEQHSSRIF